MSEAPDSEVVPPRGVVGEAGGRPLRLVWRHRLGGLTFQIGSGAAREFVKGVPAGEREGELAAEARRLEWAAAFVTVPRVLGQGSDGEGSWLRTSGLPGDNAVSPRWLAEPWTAVTAIGRGLRALHDTLPVEDCPFSWSVETRLTAARRAGEVTEERARELLARVPPPTAPVVCHGDACAPNTLLHDDGTCSGHVDFGSLGVADRWADLAPALWSVGFNYGAEWEETLLDAYGTAPDPERRAYYLDLWWVA